MEYIIYALYCPIMGVPVYIGKSESGIKRPFEHINDKSHSGKIKEWIRSLKEDGTLPVIVVLEETTNPKHLLDKETFWINKFLSEGHLLLNQKQIQPAIFTSLQFNTNKDVGYLSDISCFIKARRKILKITQKELASKAGVGLRFIRDLEQGRKKNFSIQRVAYLLNFMGAKLTVGSIK